MEFRRLRLLVLSLVFCLAVSAAPEKEGKTDEKLHWRKAQTVMTPVSHGFHVPQGKLIRLWLRPASLAGPDTVINSSWKGGTGNWTTSSAWTPGTGFPKNGGGNTYNVTIGTGNDNVTLDTNVTISSLTLGNGSCCTTFFQNLAGSTERLNILGAFTNNNGFVALTNGSVLTVGSGFTNSGRLDLDQGSSVVISGNLTNNGSIYTDQSNVGAGTNSIRVSGTLNNNAGASITLGVYDNVADTMTAETLVNNGALYLGKGSSVTLANPITSVAAGSCYRIRGTFIAGTDTALAGLNADAGQILLQNGQSTTITPNGETLNVANAGFFIVDNGSNVNILGAVNNSGQVDTTWDHPDRPSTLTVSGNLTNNPGGQLNVGSHNGTDTVNIGSLTNNGNVSVSSGSTLNLTNQPNGITDVVAGSEFDISGTFKAGDANAIAKLEAVEGKIYVENGQSSTISPGGGTLNVASTGIFDVDRGTNVTISGNVVNSGQFFTNRRKLKTANTLTITGSFTNNAGAVTFVGYFPQGKIGRDRSADTMNVDSLTNNGFVGIGLGSTLNLTSQPNGITNVVTGSDFEIAGSFKAGAADAVAKLAMVSGGIYLQNGQTTTITPGGGTFAVASTGAFDVDNGSNVTISGNVDNSGLFSTNERHWNVPSTLTVTGSLTNKAGATTAVGSSDTVTDTMNLGSLTNNGLVVVGTGSTLNLTGQPNGMTDVVAGSEFDIRGTFSAGTASALIRGARSVGKS